MRDGSLFTAEPNAQTLLGRVFILDSKQPTFKRKTFIITGKSLQMGIEIQTGSFCFGDSECDSHLAEGHVLLFRFYLNEVQAFLDKYNHYSHNSKLQVI